MFDIKKLIDEVCNDVNKEKMEDAKRRLKAKSREIEAARKVLRNLELQYAALVKEIQDELTA